MGFIKAFTGSLSGTFADQWKEFYVPRTDVTPTTAVFQAVQQSQNNGVGENTKGFSNIITNGSKIIVPNEMALITIQDGAITGCICEPGGFEFRSDDPNSQSLFAGDGLFSSTLKSSWEKVKFGGQPGSQQLAFYVNLKEISGIRFGTQNAIQWNDSWFATKVGAMMRGTYSIKIVDPLMFIKQFVPLSYLQPNAEMFDFNDINDSTDQLLNEFTSSLSAGITKLSVMAAQANQDTYDYVSMNRIEFAKEMTNVLESEFRWTSNRGLTVSNIAIQMEYDEATKELQKEFQMDDKEIRREKRHLEVEAARGDLYSKNMQGMMASAVGQSMQTQAEGWKAAGEGIKAAGEAGSLENIGSGMFMGMGMQTQPQGADALNAINNMTQANQAAAPKEDPTEKLLNAKKLLDAGAISQEDYDKLKSQILGI